LFAVVGILVSRELGNVNAAPAARFVSHDESCNVQSVKRGAHVHVIRWEDFHLDALGTILENASAIRKRPQADKQQAILEREFD